MCELWQGSWEDGVWRLGCDAKTCFVKQLCPRLRPVLAFPNISFSHTTSVAWKHAQYSSICPREMLSDPKNFWHLFKKVKPVQQGIHGIMTMPDWVLISVQAWSNGFSHRRLSDHPPWNLFYIALALVFLRSTMQLQWSGPFYYSEAAHFALTEKKA